MDSTPADVRLTTTKSNFARSPAVKKTHAVERQYAMIDAIRIPAQEPGNKKKTPVFMMMVYADGLIASDQAKNFQG